MYISNLINMPVAQLPIIIKNKYLYYYTNTLSVMYIIKIPPELTEGILSCRLNSVNQYV